MLRTAHGCLLARFQPYSMAIQTRFKWRHKETDRWRRLMDGTCFPVDWISQTRGPNLSQYSGHWSHVLTCAHVVCPWDYPNFYPPTGPTRFVSHITLADTMSQARLVSLQGTAVFKHFLSNQHVFVHNNPRLDLCVLHPEQNFKRSGEMKMLWMQNEGHVLRPRFELVEELQVGDHVWIYGMSAHESLFDEEKAPEPLMIPTGVRAVVRARTREHFFLDTKGLEGETNGTIHMGMCGSVVMRNGRCVGMLTATVHDESNVKELAGTAMCTYASDIFEFLLEVEKQMKNPPPAQQQEETLFEQRRRKEDPQRAVQTHKDWELDQSRIARHIPVPASLWHMDEKWMTEEDFMTQQVFGRSGVFNQETQESALGYDMNSSKTHGERPGDMAAFSSGSQSGKPTMQGERKDYSPTGIYAEPESFKTKDVWDYEISGEMRSLFNRSVDDKDATALNAMRQSLENIRAQRAMDKMKESAMQQASRRGGKGGASSRDMGDGAGYYTDTSSGAAENAWEAMDPARMEEQQRYEAYEQAQPSSQEARAAAGSGGAGGGASSSASARPPPPPPGGETPMEKKKRERREAEERYQAELRRRHGNKAIPFADEDLGGLWSRH